MTVGAEFQDNAKQSQHTYNPDPYTVFTDLHNTSVRWGTFAQDEIKLFAPLTLSVYASTREGKLGVVPWTPEQKATFLRMQYAGQEAHYQSHYREGSFDIVLVRDEPTSAST